jgi:hypothetical protein
LKNLTAILTQENGKLNAYRFFIFITLPFFLLVFTFSYYQHFHHYIDRDTASYIAIAFKYQQGNFFGAVNGYWSPLYSWLLAPLLFSGADPDMLLSFINGVSSLIILYQLYKIASFFKLLFYLNILLQFSFALALAQYSFVNITPDLLNLVFLVIYLRLYLTKQLFQKPVITGLLGVLMYLSKYYTFGFFLAHICLVYFIEVFIQKNKTGRAFIKTITVFLLISSLWIICLTVKYNHFLLAYSGSYNHAITKSGVIFHEWESNGLVPPAKNQLFPWEDIKQVYNYKDWSPFKNKKTFNTQVSIIKTNFKFFTGFLNANTRYGLYINFFILLLLVIKNRSLKKITAEVNVQLMLMGLVYVSGYLLIILCNDRYIWLLYFLSALSIVYFLNNLLSEQKKWWPHLLCILFLIYCLNKKQFDILLAPFEKDWDSLPQNISLFKKVIQPGDRVVSTEQITAGHFPIDTRCLYYGTTLGYRGDTLRMIKDLRDHQINYIITTDTASQKPPAFINELKKVNEPFTGIKLYRVEKKVIDSLYIAISQKK